jgi:hypothetical protein
MAKANQSKPEVTPEQVTQDVTPEATPEVNPENTVAPLEGAAEVTPEVTPDPFALVGEPLVVDAPVVDVRPEPTIVYQNEDAKKIEFTPDPKARLIEVRADGTILTSY